MTKLEIQLLLEKAYELNFLNSIELLSASNKKYIKSDFYKETKISLFELYKNYFQFMQTKFSMQDKIEEAISLVDSEYLGEQIVNLLLRIKDSPAVQEILKQIMDKLDIQTLIQENENLRGLVEKIKP